MAIPRLPTDVLLPPALSVEYSTLTTKKPLLHLRKYAERWRSIIFFLTGTQPPRLGARARDWVVGRFVAFELHFNRNRHASNCDGRVRCHKTFKCRNNIIRLNWVLRKLLLAHYRDRHHPEYAALKWWLPVPARATRRDYYNAFWVNFTGVNKEGVWPPGPKPPAKTAATRAVARVARVVRRGLSHTPIHQHGARRTSRQRQARVDEVDRATVPVDVHELTVLGDQAGLRSNFVSNKRCESTRREWHQVPRGESHWVAGKVQSRRRARYADRAEVAHVLREESHVNGVV